MSRKINYSLIAKESISALGALEGSIRKGGLEESLLELVRFRASQINGCAYCLDMHSKDARAAGETEQRLYTLSAWREAPFYSDREKAAMEWTEAVTLISRHHIEDEMYERVRKHFSEEELVFLTLAITSINTWNRLAISLGADVGSYQPRGR